MYAGLAPAGLSSPVGLPAPGLGYESTADLVAARALDLSARDYLVDDDQTAVPHEAWGELAQNVVLRLTTPRGSLPLDRTFGNRFLLLRKAPVDLVGAARDGALGALSDLISSGQVQLVSVTADRVGGTAVAVVTWRDTRTGNTVDTPISPRT